VIPSGDVDAVVPDVLDTAQKFVPFQATEFHVPVADKVRAVQAVPSGEVAATVPLVALTAQNRLTGEPAQQMLCQLLDDGNVRAVQVVPSGDVAAAVPPEAIAQNTVPFQAID
jgi:hypothetical protein